MLIEKEPLLPDERSAGGWSDCGLWQSLLIAVTKLKFRVTGELQHETRRMLQDDDRRLSKECCLAGYPCVWMGTCQRKKSPLRSTSLRLFVFTGEVMAVGRETERILVLSNRTRHAAVTPFSER